MAFPFLQLGILAASVGIRWLYGKDAESRTILPKPQLPEFEFPRSDPGTPFPYVYGRTRVTPLVSWWGGGERFEDTSTAFGFVFRASFLYTVGIPCWDAPAPPWSTWRTTNPPKLTAIYQGNIRHELALGIGHSAPTNVGGMADGTQFVATGEFFDGRGDQDLTGSFIRSAMDLAGSDTTRIPGYRHRMMVGLTECEFNSTTAPAFSFEVESLGPDPVPDGAGRYDANPAWIIYDLMCSPVWKMGLDPASIDLASFTAAAATLVTEGNGASVVVYETDEVSLTIGALLEQIDATLFEDPNGLIKLKLIRADYDIALIPTLSMANQVTRPKVNLTGWKGRFTGIAVTFASRVNDYRPDTVQGGRLASSAAFGGQREIAKFTYSGVTGAALATSIAARELAVLSRPLMTVSVRLNRDFYNLLPGDAVKANWPTLNIVDKVFRVLAVDLGQLADGGIEVTLVEDAFGQVAGAFPVTLVSSPYLLPIWDRLATEAPRWMTGQLTDQSIIADAETPRIMALAANRYDVSATAFRTQAPHPFTADAWIRDVPGDASFLRWGTIAAIYPRTAEPYDTGVGLQITAGTRLSTSLLFLSLVPEPSISQIQSGERLCVIYDRATGAHEFISFAAHITGGAGSHTIQKVWRGLLDTAPRDWPIGSTFLYLGTGFPGNVGRVGLGTGAATVRWQPYGLASGADVRVTDGLTVIGRPVLPLPAQSFSVTGNELVGTVGQGGSGYLRAVSSIDGSLTTDARPRSRTLGVITRGDSGDQGVEAGTTWALLGQRMAANGFALEESEILITDGLTSPSQAGVLLGKVGHGSIDLKLRTVNGAYESWTDPTVRIEAASYRDLLRNGHGTEGIVGWTVTTGDLQVTTAAGRGSFESLTRSNSTFRQDVNVSGYAPAGLSALLHYYFITPSVGGDRVEVSIRPYDASGTALAAATSSGVLTGSATLYRRGIVTIAALPAGTATIRVEVALTNILGSLWTAKVADLTLHLGRISGQVLLNPTFDT